MLLKPASPAKSTQIAEIRFAEPVLHVTFPERNEEFRLAVRGMGFLWAGTRWERTLDQLCGEPTDRMAETAQNILSAGFMVRIYDEDTRLKAISGEYAPENTKWVVVMAVSGDYKGWCRISWRRPDDFYQPARSILGARYHKGAIYVPPTSIIEAADFAEKYGFRMSQEVIEMLETHRALLASGVVVEQAKKRDVPVKVTNQRVPETLDVPEAVGIDGSLRAE